MKLTDYGASLEIKLIDTSADQKMYFSLMSGSERPINIDPNKISHVALCWDGNRVLLAMRWRQTFRVYRWPFQPELPYEDIRPVADTEHDLDFAFDSVYAVAAQLLCAVEELAGHRRKKKDLLKVLTEFKTKIIWPH
jgi:hypothetical protein